MREINVSFQDLNKEYDFEVETDLLIEKPIGWSSACLYPTIDYYLNCNYTDVESRNKLQKPTGL